MRLWPSRRATLASVAVIALALVTVTAGSARTTATPVPTSVTLFSGAFGGKTYTGQVAVQRTATGKARLTGLVKGLAAGKTDIALVNTADCAQPIGKELFGGTIASGKGFDLSGRLNGSIGGHSIALFFSDKTQFVCYGLPAATSAGTASVVTGNGSPSASTTGMLTARRRSAGAVGFLVLTNASTSKLSLQPSSASCTSAAKPTGPALKMAKKQGFFYGDAFPGDFAAYRNAHSLIVTGASGKLGCVKWDSAQVDAVFAA